MSQLKLTDYEISMKSGFVTEDPLTRLPPYFDPWNTTANNMVKLIEDNTFREEVLKLPVLDFTRLNGDMEIKLGHMQLVFLASGYLWQNGLDPAQVPKVLPKSLAVPLYGMYEKYDLAPIFTYADGFLYNCVIKDPQRPVTIENMSAICNIPGGEDWFWFYSIQLDTEHTFATSIPAFQNALDGVDECDEDKMTRSLEQIAEAVLNMKKVHSLIHKKLPLESFIQKMSPYFTGYDSPPLADGLIFEGVKDEPVKMSGANAGETPIFKALDALLGIKHQKDIHDHTESQLMFLYPRHREFIYDLRRRPIQLKTVVETSSNLELKEAYNKLVQAIVQFRSYHMQLVAKYFIIGMNRTMTEDQLEAVKPVKDSIVKYLKGMRDDTKQETTST